MLNYMKIIRAKAGHIPVVVCGASVIVVDEAGGILLHRRNDNHLWAYPGGAVDVDESVEDAAIREIYEETGLKIKELSLFGVYSGKDMHHIYPNGDEISNVDIVFISRVFEGVLSPDNVESCELRFFSLNDIPHDVSPPCRRAICDYVNSRE